MYPIQVIEEDVDRVRFCEGGKTVIYILVKETRWVTTSAGHGGSYLLFYVSRISCSSQNLL